MNVLKPHLQTTIATLLETNTSHRQIERVTGIDRKTIRTYAKRIEGLKANSPGVWWSSFFGHSNRLLFCRFTLEGVG